MGWGWWADFSLGRRGRGPRRSRARAPRAPTLSADGSEPTAPSSGRECSCQCVALPDHDGPPSRLLHGPVSAKVPLASRMPTAAPDSVRCPCKILPPRRTTTSPAAASALVDWACAQVGVATDPPSARRIAFVGARMATSRSKTRATEKSRARRGRRGPGYDGGAAVAAPRRQSHLRCAPRDDDRHLRVTLADRRLSPYSGTMSTRLLRELTPDEADVDSGERARALTPAARVRLVAELTRAAWEGVGRERARFCRVYSYPGATSRALSRRGRVRAGPSRVRARHQ